jgi:hypothetical protein
MEVNAATESEFARDFRSYRLLYFQLLSSFCSMVRTNVDNEARMKDSQYYSVSNMDNDDIVLNDVYSCGYSAIGCRLALLLYVNASETNWWYEDGCTEIIRDKYALLIPCMAPPIIQPLNRSRESRFHGQKFFDLLVDMRVRVRVPLTTSRASLYHRSTMFR